MLKKAKRKKENFEIANKYRDEFVEQFKWKELYWKNGFIRIEKLRLKLVSRI